MSEAPDWIATSRPPDTPGWYWVWTGLPTDSIAPARIDRDAFGNWVLSLGRSAGLLSLMSERVVWRWSEPIPGPTRARA